mmetsp:Transcript_30657/g.64142  ORF Transcript_30657/g.64142 Transcript_30657/m.64142 type:complete len:210 (-) Transcript_30657:385-1014(-)
MTALLTTKSANRLCAAQCMNTRNLLQSSISCVLHHRRSKDRDVIWKHSDFLKCPLIPISGDCNYTLHRHAARYHAQAPGTHSWTRIYAFQTVKRTSNRASSIATTAARISPPACSSARRRARCRGADPTTTSRAAAAGVTTSRRPSSPSSSAPSPPPAAATIRPAAAEFPWRRARSPSWPKGGRGSETEIIWILADVRCRRYTYDVVST